MRHFLLTPILIAAFSFNFFCLAAKRDGQTSQNSNLKADIERLIQETDPNLNIGIKISNLNNGKIAYQRNAARYFIPASSLKFVTLTALLDYFGPDYQFSSTLSKNQADYYLTINSPNFTSKDLEKMVLKLASDAHKSVNGNIYLVANQFSVPAIMREKSVSDTIYCNGSLITKVSLNKNCAKIRAMPTKLGALISLKTPTDFPYKIINKAKTSDKNVLDRLNVNIDKDRYLIDGNLSKSHKNIEIGAVTIDNFNNIIQYIRFFLKKHQIKLKGKIAVTLPEKEKIKKAEPIHQITDSYRQLAAIAMKKSDNFITDYLLAEYATKENYSEWRQAIKALKKLIYQRFKVDFSQTEIHDGSGLARRNLISVNQMSDYLTAIYQQKNIKEIKQLMVHPGEDSTLYERFKLVQNIHLKTGTMRHVSALIGYFTDKYGEEYSFVIMANNFYPYNQPYRQLEEKIIRLFTD